MRAEYLVVLRSGRAFRLALEDADAWFAAIAEPQRFPAFVHVGGTLLDLREVAAIIPRSWERPGPTG
jgi:hypothetical protein